MLYILYLLNRTEPRLKFTNTINSTINTLSCKGIIMELYTERLVLKELTLADLDEVHQLHSFPEVDEFNTLGIPGSIETTEDILKDWVDLQKVTREYLTRSA